MNVLQIADPNSHTIYNCFFVGAKKNLCELLNYTPTAPAVNISEVNIAGDLPNNQGSFLHEILGKQSISGVDTVGVHEVAKYKPGTYDTEAFGKNDREVTVGREMWYSVVVCAVRSSYGQADVYNPECDSWGPGPGAI